DPLVTNKLALQSRDASGGASRDGTMSTELPLNTGKDPEPTVFERLQTTTTELRAGLGRIAAASIFATGVSLAGFIAEEAVYPTVAEASCSGTHCDPQGTTELAGSSWLDGGGVDVYANTGSAGYDSGVNNYITTSGGTKKETGEEWQCVEL